MLGFEYLTEPHLRRHGPQGYTDYASYRDWLRDEFTFRCVYCLHREKWYGRPGTFHVEHVVPVSADPLRECDYTNLVYACATCNTAKRDILSLPDPCQVAFADRLRIQSNGEVEALSQDGERLCDTLKLNSRKNVEYRKRWMRLLGTMESTHPELFREWMGFPDDLPDLRPARKRVPKNTKPEGAESCYFALRERGELPATYA
jgi:hypothetical protein